MNYFNYFTEIEVHFQQARQSGIFLLSPLDWALIETWKQSIVDDGPIRKAMLPLGKHVVFNPELEFPVSLLPALSVIGGPKPVRIDLPGFD